MPDPSEATPKRRPGRPPGTPNPNGGRPRTLPGRKRNLMLRIEPDLHDWIKTLPPGSAERILRQAQIDALIV